MTTTESRALRAGLATATVAHALFHAGVGLGGAVMESPEELVDRPRAGAVVALKISMVQMVEVVCSGSGPALSSADLEAFEAGV